MKSYLPLFVTGIARTGGTLLARMLAAHEDVTVAVDPYLPLFRSLRNAIVRHRAPPELARGFDPRRPFQDYYFADEHIEVMDSILASDLHTPFDEREWDDLQMATARRAGDECPDLVEHIPELLGTTYKEIFDHALGIIADARSPEGCMWVGSKDVWTIEFLTPLARTYPEAKFVVILRDPRAVAASAIAGELDHTRAPHILSFSRHWRKYVAFILKYQGDPFWVDRLHVLTYEQLVLEPERTAQGLCRFLGVDFDAGMLDSDNYFDYKTGSVWQGNSSFEDVTNGIGISSLEHWRQFENRAAIKLVEFICGPEMELAGYEQAAPVGETWPDALVSDYLMHDQQGSFNWRSDFGDPQKDYGYELFRRALLSLPSPAHDEALIRRSFLFTEVFRRLRDNPVGSTPGLRF